MHFMQSVRTPIQIVNQRPEVLQDAWALLEPREDEDEDKGGDGGSLKDNASILQRGRVGGGVRKRRTGRAAGTEGAGSARAKNAQKKLR